MFRHVDVLSNRNAQNALRFPAMNENCGNHAFYVDVRNSFASICLRDATPGSSQKRLSTGSTGTRFALGISTIRQFPCGTGSIAHLSELIFQTYTERRLGGTCVILRMQIDAG